MRKAYENEPYVIGLKSIEITYHGQVIAIELPSEGECGAVFVGLDLSHGVAFNGISSLALKKEIIGLEHRL